jgi:hypothetical protein
MSRLRYESQEDDESNHKCETSRVSMHNGYTNSTTLMHNNTTGPSSLCNKIQESSMQNIPQLRTQKSALNEATIDFSTKKEQDVLGQEIGMVNNNFLFTTSNFFNSRYLINEIIYLAYSFTM